MESEENEAEVWNDEENEVQDEESGLESEELVHHALSYVPKLKDVEIEPTPSEGRLFLTLWQKDVDVSYGMDVANCSLQFSSEHSSEHFSDIRSY